MITTYVITSKHVAQYYADDEENMDSIKNVGSLSADSEMDGFDKVIEHMERTKK